MPQPTLSRALAFRQSSSRHLSFFFSLSRNNLRIIRRNASSSTGSEAASKAQSTGSTAVSKASEGLSRVTSSAGPAIAGAAKGVGNALSKVGGRTGRVIGLVESLIPPTIYYTRVGIELSKIVFRNQKMSPPDMATFQSYFQPLITAFRNPSTLTQTAQKYSASTSLNPQTLLSRLRNLNGPQWAAVGIAGAEILGFFTVGEMLGRFKIVGYRGEAVVDHDGHH